MYKGKIMKTKIRDVRCLVYAGLGLGALLFAAKTRADEVTDWNQHMLDAALVAKTSPLIMSRVAAIVHSSIYDAVNGIKQQYQPIHVALRASRGGTSARAAAAQAAYAALVKLYPVQKPTLDGQIAASLAAILANDSDAKESDPRNVSRGVAWGQYVADQIWAWRSTDGFSPPPAPFIGGTDPGVWRPTPPGFLSGAGPQFAYMTPWGIPSQSYFRPGGPPALNSDRYTADYNETKDWGGLTSTLRTADQTVACQFWAASTATYYWNRVAVSLIQRGESSLLQNARLLAYLDLAMADAAIACWEAKYHYVFWRPISAIPLADTDGNDFTVADPIWTTLLVTPNHPEYPSGHSTVSGAAAVVLAAYFGDEVPFTVDSDVMLGVTRSFTSLSNALEEVKEARIFAGIHFRSACDDGQATGQNVANYILKNSLQRLNGNAP